MVGFELRRPPLCLFSASSAAGSSRRFASLTPLENDDQPAIPQMTTRTIRSAKPRGDPPAPVDALPFRAPARGTGSNRARAGLRPCRCRRPAGCRASAPVPSSCRVRLGRRGRASRPAASGGLGYPANMNAKRVIGVDLGGTKILAGLIDADGGMHETHERPTVTTSQDALLAELVEAVNSLPHDGVSAVGFGIPSRIDHERGIALGAVNIPLSNVPFRDEMEQRLGLKVGIENDGTLRRLRRVPLRRRPRDAQLPDAHARHGRRGRRRLERAARAQLDRARPHGDRRGWRAVPRLVHRPRPRRGVLLRARGRQDRAARARPGSRRTPARRREPSGAGRDRPPSRRRDRLAREHLRARARRHRRWLRRRGRLAADSGRASRR